MQKHSANWYIEQANELSHQIDAAETRPDELLTVFNRYVRWLEQYAPHVDITATVRCPENW